MISFKDFVQEEVPVNNASGGAIASIGVGPQGEPPGKPKNKGKLFVRKPLEPGSKDK